jgi:hypothetical protein
MKTTLDLPEDLLHAVKLRAVMQRRTVKDLVTDLLRQGLGLTPPEGQVRPTSPMVEIQADGLPVIRCSPNAPAAQMSVEELLALERQALNDEDLQRAGIAL